MEEIIKTYLEERAKQDPTIAMNLLKPNKSIKGCCKYITEQALKMAEGTESEKQAMIENEVVYGWAIHYYDEDSIEDKKPTAPKPQAKVVVMQSSPNKPQTKADNSQCVQLDLF